MEMHQIKYFLASCETMNFTKAAELCNVSQPALTKAVRLLEEELGGELFDRHTRPLQLSHLGRQLRSKFAEIWDLAHDIRARAERFSKLEDAIFTLAVINSINSDLLIKLKNHLKLYLPGVSVLLQHAPESQILNDLREGSLQLGIVTDCFNADPRFTCDLLYKERYVISSAMSHPFADRDKVAINELEGLPFIQRIHCEKNDEIQKTLSTKGVNIDIQVATDQDETARRFVQEGYGVAIMPISIANGPAAAIDIEDEEIMRSVQLAASATREISPVAEQVRNALRDYAINI